MNLDIHGVVGIVVHPWHALKDCDSGCQSVDVHWRDAYGKINCARLSLFASNADTDAFLPAAATQARAEREEVPA